MSKTEKELVVIDEKAQAPNSEVAHYNIKSMIYVIRNQQVMLDSDLAMLYQVETRVFNQAVKRNIARFPDSFRFQMRRMLMVTKKVAEDIYLMFLLNRESQCYRLF